MRLVVAVPAGQGVVVGVFKQEFKCQRSVEAGSGFRRIHVSTLQRFNPFRIS
jgi:ABC-type uncharacterized transport system permease subunit